MHINSIDQIEATLDSDRYIEDNMQTEANDSHNNCKRKSNKDADSTIDNKNEEVNISCFCSITHTRNLFCIQCGKCRNWWNSTRMCIQIKKELALKISNGIAIFTKVF